MSENVVTLPGKRPAWMKALSDYLGPHELRAFIFAAVGADGDVRWMYDVSDGTDTDVYTTMGAVVTASNALMAAVEDAE